MIYFTLPGNCTPLGQPITEGSPSRTWQAGGGSFLLLPRRHALSSRWLWTSNQNTCENRLEEVQGAATSSFFTPLSRHVAMCTALVCGAQCFIPVRLGHWQNQPSNICSRVIGQWSDSSAMSGCKTLSPPGPMNYLCSLALRIWTSFWRREGSAGMDMWNAPMCSQDSLSHTGWGKAWAWEAQDDMEAADRQWLQRGSSRLSTLMIEICGDLVWDLPSVQHASYLEGGPLMWMLPLYLHINQNSDYDDMMISALYYLTHAYY